MTDRTNEQKAADLVPELVAMYKRALEAMKGGYCEHCERDGVPNASLLREIREFLKQHDIALDPSDSKLADLSSATGEVLPFARK